jgi:hypothetical protein
MPAPDVTAPPQMIMIPMLLGAHIMAHNESNHPPVSARIRATAPYRASQMVEKNVLTPRPNE